MAASAVAKLWRDKPVPHAGVLDVRLPMHLRILHNGDLRKDTPKPSPHWMVHVREDGSVWGEVLMPGWGRTLSKEFRNSGKNGILFGNEAKAE